MTTFYVYKKGHCRLTTHDKAIAESFAAMVQGHVVTVERELTAGERMRDERVAA